MKHLFNLLSIGFLFLLIGCGVQKQPQKERESYVILLGGQSNMAGHGKVAELDKWEIPSNVKFYDVEKPGLSSEPPKNFGPEVGLWRKLAENYPEKDFIFIKYAKSGASLLDWNPDYDKEKAKITGHPHFGNMFKTFLHNIDSITKDGDSEFLALLWMQGERDARFPEAGKEYYQNFTTLIQQIRQETATEDLPVLFGLVNPDPSKYPALEEVQAAQRKVEKELNNTLLIDTFDLEKNPDNLHYSTNGQLKLGEKFGEEVSRILRNRENSK